MTEARTVVRHPEAETNSTLIHYPLLRTTYSRRSRVGGRGGDIHCQNHPTVARLGANRGWMVHVVGHEGKTTCRRQR